MELTYTVSLVYDDDNEPDAAEPSPAAEDVRDWIIEGMARHGWPSADLRVVRED